MIIVPIKEGENIEKALKKFKRKFEKTGVVREHTGRINSELPVFLCPAVSLDFRYLPEHIQILSN